MKKLNLVVISLSVICRKEDSNCIIKELEDCDRGQGLYSLGTSVRKATKFEIEEVYNQVPNEYLQ